MFATWDFFSSASAYFAYRKCKNKSASNFSTAVCRYQPHTSEHQQSCRSYPLTDLSCCDNHKRRRWNHCFAQPLLPTAVLIRVEWRKSLNEEMTRRVMKRTSQKLQELIMFIKIQLSLLFSGRFLFIYFAFFPCNALYFKSGKVTLSRLIMTRFRWKTLLLRIISVKDDLKCCWEKYNFRVTGCFLLSVWSAI